MPTGIEKEPGEDSQDLSLNPPSSVFEGEWTWLETKGEGIMGPYESDSLSAGFSWKLEFTKSDGQGGSFAYRKFYKTGQREECLGKYTYTDEGEHILELACNSWLNNNRWENFLWELKSIDDKLHLYLRNVEGCCDNTFEHHFLLTKAFNF